MHDLPEAVSALVETFVGRTHDVLGESLVGVYLYGALVFPDARPVQDVDFHVVVDEPFDDRRRHEIRRMRDQLRQDVGALADELDGYYLARDDVRFTAPPRHQLWPLSRLPVDSAWALHCAHIHAGRFLASYGPDPRQLYAVPAWMDVQAALFGEVRYVDQHLADAPAYCILNAVRLLYSFTTRDVVISKRAAARWGLDMLPPERHEMIRLALRFYDGEASLDDRETISAGADFFVADMWRRIGQL